VTSVNLVIEVAGSLIKLTTRLEDLIYSDFTVRFFSLKFIRLLKQCLKSLRLSLISCMALVSPTR